MFTGIIEECGTVRSVKQLAKSVRLVVGASTGVKGVKPGDSIAVNGCCLTVVKVGRAARGRELVFDLLNETWERTNLRFVAPGSLVNLERAMAANGRFGGHFVSGHIDGTGTIVKWERSGKDHVLDVRAPRDVLRYVVFKGSVAVDGMSLTVAKALKDRFRIWIIPHTFEVTNLSRRAVGDAVNLEADLIGKYVERFVALKGSPGR